MENESKPKRLKLDIALENEEEDSNKNSSQDTDYFRSYADVSIHEEMLGDVVRTSAYRCAILKNYEKIRDKVVVDVGAGTGILSIFCVQAGAKKVYAIEASDMAEQTKLIVAENNMSDRIVVIKGKVEDIELPEEVDAIVSEWMREAIIIAHRFDRFLCPCFSERNVQWSLINLDTFVPKQIVRINEVSGLLKHTHHNVQGNLKILFPGNVIRKGYSLLYESMLQSVLHTRDKWLKKDGLMFPQSAVLYIAPFCDSDIDERLEIWSDVKSKYKVSMESMKPYARKCIASNVSVKCLLPENILSHGVPVSSFDLKSVQSETLRYIQKSFEMQCFGCSQVHGFVTWFTVSFPGDIVLSTSPYTEETHWGQTLLYLDQPFDVTQDTTISGTFTLCPNKFKNRFLDISLSYKTESTPLKHKSYYMSDCIT